MTTAKLELSIFMSEIPFDELRKEAIRLRLEEKKTTVEIKKILNLPSSTVCRWLKTYPIEKRLSALEAGHRVCLKCNIDKPNSEFNKRLGHPQVYCRECQKAYYADYYKKNGQKVIRAQVQRGYENYRESQKELELYLKDKACKICKDNDPDVLEFHHRDPKTKKACISELVCSGYTWDSILLEIEKCDVLCCKCHRKITVMDRKASLLER